MIPPAIAYAQPKSGGFLCFLANQSELAKAKKTDWKDAGVIDLSNSPYAKLKTLPVRAVVIQDGFWSQRCRTNLTRSIPSMRQELLEHRRMDNFLRLEGKLSEPQKGASLLGLRHLQVGRGRLGFSYRWPMTPS